jgi:hypothetical protein
MHITRVVGLILAGLWLASPAAPALAAERLTDRQLEQVVKNIDQGFDRWKDDLERRNLDDAVIRSASGTVKVEEFLRDFERDIDTLKDRFKGSYAAGPEVTALLRRASDVQRRNLANRTDGGAAWQTLSAQFEAMAAAYGVSWPMDTTATAQRLNDKELAARVNQAAAAADRLRSPMKKAAGNSAGVSKPAVAAAESDLKALKDAARQLENGLKNGRATSADAMRVLDLAGKSRAFVQGLGPMDPTGNSQMNVLDNTMQAVARAYGAGWP